MAVSNKLRNCHLKYMLALNKFDFNSIPHSPKSLSAHSPPPLKAAENYSTA